MKKSNLSFMDGFLGVEAKKASAAGKLMMTFDWDKAAEIVKNKLKSNPDLTAEAGLQGDWEYTGGVIFEDGKPTNENYTYLCSNWATPTLIIESDGIEEEVECFTTAETTRFDEHSKWDAQSLEILGINLSESQ